MISYLIILYELCPWLEVYLDAELEYTTSVIFYKTRTYTKIQIQDL
jgi:hypothetical protein